MTNPDWGDITIGRITLREVFDIAEIGGMDPKVSLTGQESSPSLTRAQLYEVHENILALEDGSVYPITFTQKPERNGFYRLNNVSADLVEYAGDVVTSSWKLDLDRLGYESETDIQSRLTGTVRVNDFSLTGETWHAPAIDHYAYYTGATSPSVMTRTGADGAMTVYRSLPASTSPRWGCDPSDYFNGAVRIRSTLHTPAGTELAGVNHQTDADGWSLTNGLVNLAPGASAGIFNNQSYGASGYADKLWKVTVGGIAPTWDSATVLRNDAEQCIVRLTASRSPGRVTLDLTLRRGSRFVEGYLQSGSSATLDVFLNAAEVNSTASASAGYIVATNDDADGNRATCGSARTFTGHADLGITKTATTFLDFYLGAVIDAASPASGDADTDLRNQYIGALAESTYTVRR